MSASLPFLSSGGNRNPSQKHLTTDQPITPHRQCRRWTRVSTLLTLPMRFLSFILLPLLLLTACKRTDSNSLRVGMELT